MEIKGTTRIVYGNKEEKSSGENNIKSTKYEDLVASVESAEIKDAEILSENNSVKSKIYNAKKIVGKKLTPHAVKFKKTKAYILGEKRISQARAFLKGKLDKHVILKAIITKCLDWVEISLKYVLNPTKHPNTNTDILKYTRGPAIFGLWVTIVTTICMLIWGMLAPLNSAARVDNGILVLESKKRVLQSQFGGQINRIYVKDGDEVEKGELLVSLDKTTYKARAITAKLRFYTALAENARLIAERDNLKKIIFPEDLITKAGNKDIIHIMQTQEKIFTNKSNLINNRISAKEEEVKQVEERLHAYEEQLLNIQKQLDITEDRLNAMERLAVKGNSSKFEVQEYASKRNDYQSRKLEVLGAVAQSKKQIDQLKHEIATIKSQFITETETELRKNQESLEVQRAEMIETANILENMDIISPAKGVVSNIFNFTEGGTVQRDVPIMEIIPQDDKLIFEGRISPQDIDVVHVGQDAIVRMSPFKSREVPPIMGKVISVSADLVMPRMQGEMPHYKVRIEFERGAIEKIEREKKVKFYPGMPGDGQITIGTRTFFKYLFDPITSSFNKAFIEQ